METRVIFQSAERRAGDWDCPKCGDMQFARNQKCRQCNTTKPDGLPSTGYDQRPGDWNCQGCGDLQFSWREHCRKCGASKSGGPGVSLSVNSGNRKIQPGDWTCPRCNDHQFARNSQCRQCRCPRPNGLPSLGAPVSLNVGHRDMQPGDWICPQCKDHQFARNSSCRRCNCPKPKNMPSWGDSMVGGMPGKNQGGGRPGDWTCPSCKELQFSYRDKCRRCQTERSSSMQSSSIYDHPENHAEMTAFRSFMMTQELPKFPPPSGDFEMGSRPQRPNIFGMDTMHSLGINPLNPLNSGMGGGFGGFSSSNANVNFGSSSCRPGDWICPRCSDHQFARNVKCRQCGEPKPSHILQAAFVAGGKRPGDWKCPQCGDIQFARNTHCRKCDTPKPEGIGCRPGDWTCGDCGDLQFAYRKNCRKCNKPKPVLSFEKYDLDENEIMKGNSGLRNDNSFNLDTAREKCN